jgi:hypothetical protein
LAGFRSPLPVRPRHRLGSCHIHAYSVFCVNLEIQRRRSRFQPCLDSTDQREDRLHNIL